MPLRPEQLEAVKAFKNNQLLVGTVGSGKTYVAKGIIEITPAPILYLCRATALKEQAEKIDSDKVMFLSHEAILSKKNKKLLDTHWSLIVVDESHRFLHWTGKRVKKLLKMKADNRLMMSATPIPNGLKDAGVILKWLRHPCSDVWGCYTHYKTAELIENPYVLGMITGVKRPSWMAARLAEVTHEMKSDHKTLVPTVIKVVLGKEQRLAYDELLKESLLEAEEGMILATTPAILQLRLRQFVSHPLALGHNASSAKEQALMGLLGNVKGKCLIFTVFASVARLLAVKHGWQLIEGATPKKERQLILESHPDILIMTSAGEESIDCEWADTVITYDLPFHNGHITQQGGRANRLNRIGEVKHYILEAVDTVDQKDIMHIIRKKLTDAKRLHEAVINQESCRPKNQP